MKRTKVEVEQNEERALRRVTELARENANLHRWLRLWRRLPEVSITNLAGPPEHDRGREIPTAHLDAAMGGAAPPKVGKR